jgi:hypothetical protein
LFSATCFGKSVVIDMDGEQEQVFVYAKNVDDVLKKANIELAKEDKISANRDDEIYNGQVLYVDRAIPVEFEVNGTTTQFLTTAPTVMDFLGENNIILDEFDLITPGPDATLTKDSRIVLTKAETEIVVQTEEIPFETVSMDFIFALPGQTYDDLKSDIDKAFSLGANHIAIYPFIDFTFTESPVAAMPKKEKRELLDAITQYCLGKGYSRSSIWTFSSEPDANYSSMTRDNFLGFGCSATSLFKGQFKINTFDVESYCERIRSGNLATSLTIRFTKRQRMIYWLFWTAYSTRVNARDFEKFFGVPLKKMYGFEFWVAKRLGFIKEHDGIYEMTLKGAFYYHYYENFYTLSYIDKMWRIMRKEAFPEQIKL